MITYFVRNLLVIYVLLFIIGLLSCWRLSLSYIYGQEIVATSIQNLTGSFFNLYDATVMIQSSLYFMYISTNWVQLHTFFILCVAYSFLVFCYLPESPKYLVQKKEYERAMESYNFIAKVNKTK
jgi:hypothetical protein